MSGARYDELLAPPRGMSLGKSSRQSAGVAREAVFDRAIRSDETVKVRERRVSQRASGLACRLFAILSRAQTKATAAAAPITCSQLSRMSRSWLPASRAIHDAALERVSSYRAVWPRADATRWATRPGSESGASSTNQTPSRKRSRTARPVSILVLGRSVAEMVRAMLMCTPRRSSSTSYDDLFHNAERRVMPRRTTFPRGSQADRRGNAA
jgi:hypothetical protein